MSSTGITIQRQSCSLAPDGSAKVVTTEAMKIMKSDARAMPQQSKDHSSDDLIGDGDSSDAASTHAETPDRALQQQIQSDDLIVQILVRLDGKSYIKALQQDARSITENFLAPIHFPWHSRAKLPQKIVKTIPRDIDDLAVITHCQEELHAPFGDFVGPFGFGRYENGQSKGNYSNTFLAESAHDSISQGFASARRSHDPGAIELNVRLPSSSIAAIATKSEWAQGQAPDAKRKADVSTHSSLMLSRLPFNWRKKSVYLQTTHRYVDHSASAKSTVKFNDSDTEIRSSSCAQIALAKSCMRKWMISMKIDGVSSRTTIFPSSTVRSIDPNDDQVLEHARIVIRPMLCVAVLPQSVQSGLTVSLEKASEMDNDGFARSLGSYDCRFTEALFNYKRDVSNRLKRIEVGRTRLVWSNIPGDEPFLPSTRNRVNFNSLITGRRIDVSKCKRPREVKVGIRLNGRLIMEKAVEELPSTTNGNSRKRKHSLRQAEIEVPVLKSSVEPPESRTNAEIDAALCIFDYKSSANGSVVYLEMGKGELFDSYIDRNNIIASLLKCNQKKSAKKKFNRSASNDTISIAAARMAFGGDPVIMKPNTPRIACVPLEDGLMRTFCLNAGNMPRLSAHLVLCSLIEEESKQRCSVCFSDEGSGKEGVQECVDCHLLAHSSCCFDKGKFFSNFSETRPLDPPQEVNSAAYNTNGIQGATERIDARAEQWKCAVCCHYTQPPSRLSHSEMNTVSNISKQNDVASRSSANIPGPQCFLCPHQGGAMSLLESSQGSDRKHQTWIHEVCRIWSCRNVSEILTKKDGLSFLSRTSKGSPLVNVCALCGTDGMGDGGLTKCAARSCLIAFHPMCALLASKLLESNVGMNGDTAKAKSVRKTRRTKNTESDMKSDDKEKIATDQKLSSEYTLQLVKLNMAEGSGAVIPVAFCGIHNPQRDDSFYGCLPCGVAI